MTQARKEIQKKRVSRDNSRQTALPLAPTKIDLKAAEKFPKSKLIFQLKTELHRLQQRDREWKLMFHMLSHDLKEPILTLEGFTKLLEESGLETKDQKRYLKIIRESVTSLHHLIGSLQSISKLYHTPQELIDVSLKELLTSVMTSLAEQTQRTHGTISLPQEDLVVKGDPIRLYQIFLNLIGNSLKFHKKNEDPTIQIFYRKESDFYKISIKDNGVGINPQDLKRIFIPFTRLEDVPTDGMGIGLSIVKRIAESFGGKVQVRSQQNIGTTFTVCLPRIGRS